MKKSKQILAIALMVLMAVACMPMMPGVNGRVNATTEGWTTIGSCEYQLTGDEGDKTLTIRPIDNGSTGTLPDGYDENHPWPWAEEAYEITSVDIKSGVKAGDSTSYMFNWFNTQTIDLSNLDTSNVETMKSMFSSCGLLKSADVSKLNTSKVENMGGMFYECPALENLDVSNFDTTKVTNMGSMFNGCYALKNLDVSNFDTSKVTNMNSMFKDCHALENLDVSNFDTSNVKSMASMFYTCEKLTELDLSNFDTAQVEKMEYMFENCYKLATIYVSNKFNTSNVSNKTERMFMFSEKLVGGAGTKYDSNKLDITYAHIDGGTANPGYFTEKVAPAPAVAKTAFVAQGKAYKKSVAYSWNAVDGAASYKVYQVKCGKKKYKKIKTTTGLSYTKKKLKRKTTYKTYVVAYNAAGQAIAQTPIIHNMTTKGKKSNATAVAAAASANIKVGASTNVGAAITAKDSKKKLLWKNHVSAPIRYYSGDPAVATVDANGNVCGVAAGIANIYSVAPTGVCAVTSVTVKSKSVTFRFDDMDPSITTEYSTWKEAAENNFVFTVGSGKDAADLAVIAGKDGKVYLRYEGDDVLLHEDQFTTPVLITDSIKDGNTYWAGW